MNNALPTLVNCIDTWVRSHPVLRDHFQVISGRPAPSPIGQSTVEFDRIVYVTDGGYMTVAVIYKDFVSAMVNLKASSPTFFADLEKQLNHLLSLRSSVTWMK